MAFRAVPLRRKGGTAGIVAASARSLCRFSGLVHGGFEIERCFGLGKQLVMTGLAIILRALDVRGMIEGHVAILGLENDLIRSFLRQ